MKIDAYTENKFVAIKEYGIHEVLTRCLVWDDECRADEFEIIVLFNNDKVMNKKVFGHRTLEMCLESVLRELQENGVELIQIS